MRLLVSKHERRPQSVFMLHNAKQVSRPRLCFAQCNFNNLDYIDVRATREHTRIHSYKHFFLATQRASESPTAKISRQRNAQLPTADGLGARSI